MRKLIVFSLLAIIVVSGYAGVAARGGHSGFPLDDAWIHQTYARNWAQTGQLAYVPGVPSSGSTAPLWTLLLSFAYRFNVDPYWWTLLLGALGLGISAWLLSRLAERLLPNRPGVSWLVGLACVLEWHLIWAAASGMETLLFIALGLALIDRVQAEASGWIIGLFGGLLILARPEGLLLFALACGAMVVSRQSGRRGLAEIAKALGVFLLVLAPGAYFNLQAGGSIFPNTFYAKQSEYGVLMSTPAIWLDSIGKMLIAPLAGPALLLIPGVVMWVVTFLREALSPGAPPLRGQGVAAKHSPFSEHEIASHPSAPQQKDAAPLRVLAMTCSLWLPLVWMLLHISVYAVRLPVAYQHGRYLLPIIPVVLLYGGVGTALIADWLKARRARLWARLARPALVTVIVLLFGLYLPIGARAYAADVDVIDGEMVAVAQWLDQHTPPKAIIAAHDIGAIGYFTRRPLLDLAGLISPEVIPFIRDEARLGEWMKAKGAQYFVTFPAWYPRLSSAPDLTPLFAGHSLNSPEHMTVYALDHQP